MCRMRGAAPAPPRARKVCSVAGVSLCAGCPPQAGPLPPSRPPPACLWVQALPVEHTAVTSLLRFLRGTPPLRSPVTAVEYPTNSLWRVPRPKGLRCAPCGVLHAACFYAAGFALAPYVLRYRSARPLLC